MIRVGSSRNLSYMAKAQLVIECSILYIENELRFMSRERKYCKMWLEFLELFCGVEITLFISLVMSLWSRFVKIKGHEDRFL